jgi:hypothetical protein
MRPEVPRHAHIGLVEAEVHAADRDEVHLAQFAGVQQLADEVDGRAVEERVARHQHEPALPREMAETQRRLRRRAQRLFDEDVLASRERGHRDGLVARDRRRDRDGLDLR